jgi:hypothetical protein
MIKKALLFIVLLYIRIGNSSGQLDNMSIKQTEKYSNHSIGGNFFLGQGIYSGKISNFFSDPFYVGINLDYYTKRLMVQFDDYIGFGKTKQTIHYPNDDVWDGHQFVLSGMINLSIGYCLIDNAKIMIVPLGGAGFNKLSANTDELYDFTNKVKPVLPHLKFGGYIDLKQIKLFKKNNEDSYACPRLSFGMNIPVGNPNYKEYYDGNQFYITLGLAGLGKLN